MNITKLILSISIVFLVLFGCRQADVYEDISLQSSEKEKIEFFERFERQIYGDSIEVATKLYNRTSLYRGGYASDISYHLPFSEMIDNFMNNHPKFKQNFIKEIGNVSYRVYSKTYGYGPTSSKSMAFPIVYGGEVSGILLCYISPHRDTAEFVVLKNDDPKVSNLISVFQEALDASYPTLESIHSMGRDTREIVDAGVIEEVVLYHHRKKDSSGGGGIAFNNWDWYKDYLMERYGQRIEIHGQYLRRGGAGQAMSGGSNKHKKMPDRIEGDEGDVQDNNPCDKAKEGVAKANELAKKNFLGAKDEILNAYKYGVGVDKKGQGMENGVAFGYNQDGAPQRTRGVQNFGENSGVMSNPFKYPTADMHNHPKNTPPSTGDVYKMMELHLKHNTFRTRYVVLSDGTMYALVVTDTNAIREFLQKYPYKQNPGYGPIFPDNIFDEWYNFTFEGYGNDEMALSYILDKYNAGIALTKIDKNGNFKKVNVSENISNGTTIYKQTECP